jgi:hypothetical protein
MLKRTLIISLSLLLYCISYAQTASSEMQQLIKVYQQKTEYNYALRFDFFGENDTNPKETMNGQSTAKGGRVYYKLGTLESVKEKGLVVVIDHEDKYVLIDKVDAPEIGTNPNPSALLENMTKRGLILKFEHTNDGKKIIKGYGENGTTLLSAIIYDSNYNIEKMITYYDKEYSNYLTNDENDASRMEVSVGILPPSDPPLKMASIVKLGKEYQLTANYHKYQFYNQLSQQDNK